MGKAALAGISLILVVGVVIGTIAIANRGKGNAPSGDASTGGLSSGMKAAETLCSPTDYKDACMEALRPVAEKDGNASPRDFVAGAFEATMNEVKRALEKSGSLESSASKDYDKQSMKSCKDLMDAAEYELKAAIEKVKNRDEESAEELLDDLNAWLSSVTANSESCLDDLQDPELKKSMKEVLEKVGQLTDNALAIIDEVAKLIGGINITIPDFGQSSRKLLAADGYPSWLSAADRKLLAAGNHPRPNAVVAKDGSGQYRTITAAVNAYPKNNRGKYVIYVKAGIYDEFVEIPKKMTNVYMYGDGHDKTIIRGSKNFKLKGIPTMQTASFAAVGNGFTAADIGFENTAGPEGHQAVALRVQSDLSIFTRCRMDGYQDTFYYQSLRSFYHDCIIYGTIDYIFGRGTAVIQNSKIITRMP
ncbi:pectinesterase family protein, partial [Ralstonia pseudosolanacearum]|uniref:pectinesterase family protein n=1 Tax=Ralstonia pseudosolanacearum TaxID=1310165 RepID=UPI003CF77BD8